MIALVLCLACFDPCATLPPVDRYDIARTLGHRVLLMAELQNRRAGVPPWYLQTTTEVE